MPVTKAKSEKPAAPTFDRVTKFKLAHPFAAENLRYFEKQGRTYDAERLGHSELEKRLAGGSKRTARNPSRAFANSAESNGENQSRTREHSRGFMSNTNSTTSLPNFRSGRNAVLNAAKAEHKENEAAAFSDEDLAEDLNRFLNTLVRLGARSDFFRLREWWSAYLSVFPCHVRTLKFRDDNRKRAGDWAGWSRYRFRTLSGGTRATTATPCFRNCSTKLKRTLATVSKFRAPNAEAF
jgi:hypothetical protein